MATLSLAILGFGFFSCLNALAVRIAARILRYSVTFRRSFLFGCILSGLVILLRRILWRTTAEADFQYCLQQAIVALCALPLFVLLIGWLFREHGTNASRQVLGWRGSIRLSLCAFIFWVLIHGSLTWTMTVMH